ncbi:hypothetical protein [uncultured Desulfobacter sp.]|uniref:hypothetical protein n=1 Tax=uncultured Desulfobacter sp. TaxID=240139 RepID=UPI002AAAA575|nr:hypothetical protein [uncultured Desulfobacter sp.]
MHKIIKIWICIFAGAFVVSTAQGKDLSSVELKLMGLINQQRDVDLVLNTKLCLIAESIVAASCYNEFGIGDAVTPLTAEDVGYPMVSGGSEVAVLMFSNYMRTGNAAQILFDHILQQIETNNDENSPSSAEMLEVGIQVYETQVELNGMRFNAYIGAVVWGQPMSALDDSELVRNQILNLLNQQRATLSIAPLFPEDMISWDYESSGYSVSVRYELESVSSQANIANTVFNLLGENDLLMSADFHSVGIDVAVDLAETEDGYAVECRVTFEMHDADIEGSWLIGVVYADLNENGVYDIGEGLAKNPMVIYDAGIHSKTASAGVICEEIESSGKGYQIILFVPDQNLLIHEANQSNQEFILININDESAY